MNGVSPGKEPLALAATVAATNRLPTSGGQKTATQTAVSGGAAVAASGGQPAPLNFSLPHTGSSSAAAAAEDQKKPEETHQGRTGSGGLYRPYSTSPTPSRTLPGAFSSFKGELLLSLRIVP